MSSAAVATDRAGARATWTAVTLAALLCVGVVALAFASGGYFAGATGVAEAIAAVALVGAIVVAPSLLTRWSAPLVVAVAAFGAFALWTLLSSNWSDSPSRALIEADRALLYVLAVAIAGLAGTVASVRRSAQAGLIGALTIISVSGLITRLLPDVWAPPAGMELERLSYPVGYWNAMGAIGALAAIGCLHLASDATRHRALRVAAAAATPLVVTTIVLTFSRGAIALGVLGVLLALILARTSGTFAALVATMPASAIAVGVVLRNDAIADGATHPGHGPALIVLLCAVIAGGIQAALHGWRPSVTLPHPRVVGGVAAAAVVAVLIGAIATGAAGAVIDRAGDLTESSHVKETGDERQRLTQLSDNGRIDGWKVSLDALSRSPLHGSGAGMFAVDWARDRPGIQEINDGHSLLFESLGELGIVGTGLLVLGIGALGWGAIRTLRRSDRAAGALGLAVLVTWTLHACIDWDWEMPALTIPALAIAALVAGSTRASASETTTARGPGWPTRAIAAAALVCLALVGTSLALSQRDVDAAIAAVHSGRCEAVADAARGAMRFGDQRPEPHQALAACAVQAGDTAGALREMRRAHELDPGDWRLVYNIAVIQALDGNDPRPALREARAMNPRSWFLRIGARELRMGNQPKFWRANARRADLLV